jgi:hypothetical protein
MPTLEAAFPLTMQAERANFLNLLIIDDERPVGEACREVARSLGSNDVGSDSAEHG